MGAARAVKAYLDLFRISNLPTVWTNVLSAGVLAAGRFDAHVFLILALSLSCFYLGGMSLNDVCDIGYDRLHRPSRPIPSGRVSMMGAGMATLAMFFAGFAGLALSFGLRAVLAGIALLAAIVIYDLHHKKSPLSVLVMASCRLLIFVAVSLAVTDRLPWLPLAAGGLQFCYAVAISLVARHENSRRSPFPFPVIPAMLAGISLLDGAVMAVLSHPAWFAAGVAGAVLTWLGQRFVRGD